MQGQSVELAEACRSLARTTMKSASIDLIETVGDKFESCALLYERRVIAAGQAFELLVTTVNYINEVLAHGEVIADVQWFDATLEALLELVAPSRAFGPAAIKFRSQTFEILRNANN